MSGLAVKTAPTLLSKWKPQAIGASIPGVAPPALRAGLLADAERPHSRLRLGPLAWSSRRLTLAWGTGT